MRIMILRLEYHADHDFATGVPRGSCILGAEHHADHDFSSGVSRGSSFCERSITQIIISRAEYHGEHDCVSRLSRKNMIV